jgi:hypothetical protein
VVSDGAGAEWWAEWWVWVDTAGAVVDGHDPDTAGAVAAEAAGSSGTPSRRLGSVEPEA